jgi:hypothetical protein
VSESLTTEYRDALTIAAQALGASLTAVENPPNRLLVLEDLGDRPPLMNILQRGNPEEAAEGLERFLTLLGQLHAATYGHEDRFQTKRQALQAPEPPTDDAKVDLRDLRDDFARNLTRLNILVPDGFAAEIAAVSAAIHDDPTFRVYTHSDAGPHNVQRGKPYRLFDFEFAGFRSGMLDASGPRMSFSSAYHGRPSPPEVVRRAEAAYRAALATTVPAAQDDRLFNHALLHGCAHWTFRKMSAGLDDWLKDHQGEGLPPFPKTWATSRSRI